TFILNLDAHVPLRQPTLLLPMFYPFHSLFCSFFFFKQKTAYEIGLGIPAEPLFRSGNHNELNQDDARYGFRCCHLKNIWTAPLPPETELSRQMTTRSEERRVGKECRSRWLAEH